MLAGRGGGIGRAVTVAARDARAKVIADGRAGQGGLLRRHERPQPVRRIGTTDDIANGVLFAITSPFLTGQMLHIDGGEPLT